MKHSSRTILSWISSTAAAFLVGDSALAQATWTRQAPIPTNDDLHAAAVVSAAEYWACGGPGLVVHTSDSGQTWQVQQLATNSLWALHFLDAQHGWAAGNGFFHTTDGGQNWIQDNSWGSITDLHFIDAQRGWACGNGGVTYRSTDGGLSWSYQAVGPITTLSSIFFVDALLGWTVNIDGMIYQSVDGGQSWTMQHDANGYLSTVQFFDAQDGWAIGGDTFLHTVDGGQNWSQVSVPAGTWSHGARFADRQHGISVGEYGNVTISSDFGQSWTTISAIGTGPRLWDVEAWDTMSSIYAGETGGLARTVDGGSSWTSMQSGGPGSTHGLDAVDALHAWAAHDGGEISYTQDGGAHWQRVVVDGFDNYGRVQDVDFLDAQLGWAGGRHDFFNGGFGQISRSTDGGRQWQLQHSVFNGYIDDVEVLDAQTVLALGNVPFGPRFILRTTDSGQSWTDVAPSQAVFMDADFIDTNTGWVVGGLIYKSTDGGRNWVQQGGVPADLLLSVSFADANHGWAVGWWNTLLHTTDGGQTWTPQDANTTSHVFFDVQAFSPSVARICGANGFMARTDDGGQTWIPESVAGSTEPFETLCFLDPDRGWVGGSSIWWREPPNQAPIAYCTAGTTSNGCVASITGAGTPSASAQTGFTLSVNGVEGNKLGLVFYGISGRAALPWGNGTSFLCVQPPVQRLPPQLSGGNSGVCNGAFGLDWNAWRTAHPNGLGAPFGPGQTIWAQGWFRDPPAPTATNLSNGLEFTLIP